MGKKVGMKGSPPSVGVTNKGAKEPRGKRDGPKIVGMDNQPIKSEEPEGNPEILCLGTFVIPQAHLVNNLQDLQEFMKDVVIVEASLKMTSSGNMLYYVGISPKYFKQLPEGAPAPMYNIKKRLDGLFIVEMMQPTQPAPSIIQ